MIREKSLKTEYVIDLTGPEGNAFALLAHARKLSKILNLDAEKIMHEMTRSDYEHLIKVFDNHFGDYVILER